jgi:hypothetical protein
MPKQVQKFSRTPLIRDRQTKATVTYTTPYPAYRFTGGAWSGWLQRWDPQSGQLLREIQFSTGNTTPRAACAPDLGSEPR